MWFLPWYPLSGAGELYSSGTIVLQPTGGSPTQLAKLFLPAGIIISATVSACEKCFIGIWGSDSYVLGTFGVTTSEFVAPRPGEYALYGVNSDSTSHPIEVSLSVPRMSPWDIILRLGVGAIVLTLPFFLCAGLMIDVGMLRITIEQASISSTSVVAQTDIASKDLLLRVHEYFDATKKIEKYLGLVFLALFILVPLSIIVGGFSVYLASRATGTPQELFLAWNNPATLPIVIYFLLMFVISLVAVPPMIMLLRFNMKWAVRVRRLREMVKAAASGATR